LLAGAADFFWLQRPDPLRLFQFAEQISSAEIQLNGRRHARPLIAESGDGVAELLSGQTARQGTLENIRLLRRKIFHRRKLISLRG